MLKKSTEIWSDSFFIAGAPYPQLLLDAFGVSQGQTTFSVTYSFFLQKAILLPYWKLRRGQFSMLAEFGVEVSATQEIGEHTIPFKYYPNPTRDLLNLEFEKTTNEPWVFSIYNSIGQKVFNQLISQPKGMVNESITLKKQFPTGNYIYTLQYENQRVISSGGLIMK